MTTVIANDRSWAFIHVPKTGGTWVATLLAAQFPDALLIGSHNSVKELREAGRIDESTFTFGFIRHPLMWYESWWKFWMAKAGEGRDYHKNVFPSFSKTIRSVLSQRSGMWSQKMTRATLGLNFTGRYESLYVDLLRVFHDIKGKDFQIFATQPPPPANVSPPRKRDLLSRPLYNRLITSDAVTAARFGYEFTDQHIELFCGKP